MEIKARAFPHPVLGPSSDDFTDGEVRLADVAAEAAPERYTLKFRFEVTHPGLRGLIWDGFASAAVVIECRQNLYRRRYAVQIDSPTEMTIPADELRGEVQVTPVISATRDLENYHPQSLNSDYEGMLMSVPRHGLLAYGPNLEFIADPKADRLRKISSIMRVVPVADAGRAMKVNIGGPRIRVEVSSELFKSYQSVAATREGSQVLASMLVLPVLLEVFHRIKGNTDGFDDFRWFQIIRARLREIKQPCDAVDFDPLKAAQALLDSPFARGITELLERLCPD